MSERVIDLSSLPDDWPSLPASAPECFALELIFPGFIRSSVVSSLSHEIEEREPGFIRSLPPSLAVECALVDNAIWQCEHDPLSVREPS